MNVFVSKLSFVVLFIALVLLGFYLGIRIFFISIPFLIAYLLSRPLSKLTTILWFYFFIHSQLRQCQIVLISDKHWF